MRVVSNLPSIWTRAEKDFTTTSNAVDMKSDDNMRHDEEDSVMEVVEGSDGEGSTTAGPRNGVAEEDVEQPARAKQPADAQPGADSPGDSTLAGSHPDTSEHQETTTETIDDLVASLRQKLSEKEERIALLEKQVEGLKGST